MTNVDQPAFIAGMADTVATMRGLCTAIAGAPARHGNLPSAATNVAMSRPRRRTNICPAFRSGLAGPGPGHSDVRGDDSCRRKRLRARSSSLVKPFTGEHRPITNAGGPGDLRFCELMADLHALHLSDKMIGEIEEAAVQIAIDSEKYAVERHGQQNLEMIRGDRYDPDPD